MGGATPQIPDDEPLPIDALLATSGSAAESGQREFDRRQNLVQECMAREGFEYFPVGIAVEMEIEVETLPSAELDAFALEHGYGLTELLLSSATALDAIRAGVLPHNIEFDLDALGVQVQPEMDQNDLYIQTLRPDEVDAYYNALDGPAIDDEREDGGSDLGCSGKPDTVLDADYAAQQDAAPPWLNEALLLIDDRMQSAQGEFDQVEKRWAQCMSENGFDGFSSRLEAPESIRASLLDVVLQATSAEDEFDNATLQRLHEHEMAVAAADAGCYSTVYRPGAHSIEHRVQTEVLTELGVIEG